MANKPYTRIELESFHTALLEFINNEIRTLGGNPDDEEDWGALDLGENLAADASAGPNASSDIPLPNSEGTPQSAADLNSEPTEDLNTIRRRQWRSMTGESEDQPQALAVVPPPAVELVDEDTAAGKEETDDLDFGDGGLTSTAESQPVFSAVETDDTLDPFGFSAESEPETEEDDEDEGSSGEADLDLFGETEYQPAGTKNEFDLGDDLDTFGILPELEPEDDTTGEDLSEGGSDNAENDTAGGSEGLNEEQPENTEESSFDFDMDSGDDLDSFGLHPQLEPELEKLGDLDDDLAAAAGLEVVELPDTARKEEWNEIIPNNKKGDLDNAQPAAVIEIPDLDDAVLVEETGIVPDGDYKETPLSEANLPEEGMPPAEDLPGDEMVDGASPLEESAVGEDRTQLDGGGPENDLAELEELDEDDLFAEPLTVSTQADTGDGADPTIELLTPAVNSAETSDASEALSSEEVNMFAELPAAADGYVSDSGNQAKDDVLTGLPVGEGEEQGSLPSVENDDDFLAGLPIAPDDDELDDDELDENLREGFFEGSPADESEKATGDPTALQGIDLLDDDDGEAFLFEEDDDDRADLVEMDGEEESKADNSLSGVLPEPAGGVETDGQDGIDKAKIDNPIEAVSPDPAAEKGGKKRQKNPKRTAPALQNPGKKRRTKSVFLTIAD